MPFRQFTGVIGTAGTAEVDVWHNNTASEWDIYQISVSCGSMTASCIVQLMINGCFLCATPQGSLDTATGPPDVILNSTDVLGAFWSAGIPGDTVVVNVWYDEAPVGASNAGSATPLSSHIGST
jgi:hypothetical protein